MTFTFLSQFTTAKSDNAGSSKILISEGKRSLIGMDPQKGTIVKLRIWKFK